MKRWRLRIQLDLDWCIVLLALITGGTVVGLVYIVLNFASGAKGGA